MLARSDSRARAVSASMISVRSIVGLDPMQGTLGNEDAAASKCRRRLGDRDGAEAGDLADEPKASEKSLGLDRPPRPQQIINRREVLGQGAEIGVEARLAARGRSLADCLDPGAIVASQRVLAEELTHRVVEVLAGGGTLRDTGESRPQAGRRVSGKPLRSSCQGICHRIGDRRRWRRCGLQLRLPGVEHVGHHT